MRFTIKGNGFYFLKRQENGKAMDNYDILQELGKYEDVMEEYEIVDIDNLRKLLQDYDDSCAFVLTVSVYLKEKGLLDDFQTFLERNCKDGTPTS